MDVVLRWTSEFEVSTSSPCYLQKPGLTELIAGKTSVPGTAIESAFRQGTQVVHVRAEPSRGSMLTAERWCLRSPFTGSIPPVTAVAPACSHR